MCYYFSRTKTTAMNKNTANTASLENLNLVATVSSILSGCYFIAVNFVF